MKLTEAQSEALIEAAQDGNLETAVEAIVAPYVEALERVEALAAEWEGRWDVPRPGVLDMDAKAYRSAADAIRAAAALAPATTEEGR